MPSGSDSVSSRTLYVPGSGTAIEYWPSSSVTPSAIELAVGGLDDDAHVGNAFADLLAVLFELVLHTAAERLIGVLVLGGGDAEVGRAGTPIGTASRAIRPPRRIAPPARSPHCHGAWQGTTSRRAASNKSEPGQTGGRDLTRRRPPTPRSEP